MKPSRFVQLARWSGFLQASFSVAARVNRIVSGTKLIDLDVDLAVCQESSLIVLACKEIR